MKYNETIAYQCRYGEVAERIGGGDIRNTLGTKLYD